MIRDWFTAQGWSPFPFQEEVWEAYARGESGLVHSPTGTGKTYAVWLAALQEWLDEGKTAKAPPLRVLWITPLRALAADTVQSLQAPLRDLDPPWTVETRTGDTADSVRRRQRSRLPSTLLTTPESLSLLLTWKDAAGLFADLRLVVVDEWHELLGTKRGVQTELCLARLRRWRPDLRLWGLSATMGDLDAALHSLLGEGKSGRLVRGDASKRLIVDAIIPERIERFPWSGHLGLHLLPQALDIIAAHRSTLVFTNTRSQTERWFQEIVTARPEWGGEVALHHGSLDRAAREEVENRLRAGELRCVVCTSSLDLGVDFPAVERVLQVGSPKGAARLLQRAGRSGHQPGAESRVTCVPAHALELLEISAARSAIQEGKLESRQPFRNPLDVLAQHLVTLGIGGGFTEEDLYQEVRTTAAYATLSREEWAWTLDFVARGGPALRAYPQFNRVREENGRYAVSDRQVERLHRLSIGTIVGDASLQVRYLTGGTIGSVEESFVARLKSGDRFTLGGKVLEFVRLREMQVWVRKAPDRGAKGFVPRWYGGGLPLSDELTATMREKLDAARQGYYDDAEMTALLPLLELQARLSRLPGSGELLVETVKTREGHHLFFYPFEGRWVHEGLAALTAYRLSRLRPITFTLAANDYGFELLSPEPAPLEEALAAGLLAPGNLLEDVLHSLNLSEMAKRQFREIARIAGLVAPRFPGVQKTLRQLQASSGLVYEVFERYDPQNLLLHQARREVLQRQLEEGRLARTLERIAAGTVVVQPVARPTPFAFPLLVDRMRQTVSSETLEDRIRQMQLRYERQSAR